MAESLTDAGPYNLIETFADRVIATIFERFASVTKAKVTIRKPGAPIEANFDTVGVSIERPRMQEVGFSFGSNVGEKTSQIRAAIAFLEAVPGVEIEHVSSFYKTAPWGKEDQDAKEIEVQLGRTPGERWGPRLIDIDLLYLGDQELQSVALSLPHPEMLNRAFVVIPLAEIDGDRTVKGQSIAKAAQAFEEISSDVEVLTTP